MLPFVTLHALFLFSALCIAGDLPPAIQAVIRRADPEARTRYCGSVATGKGSYFLFFLTHDALSGLVVVGEQPGITPKIVYADTSLPPFEETMPPSVQDGLKVILQKREGSSCSLNAIGQRIDEIISPISGVRLGTSSTIAILRLLQTGRTLSLDPNLAPPGSIIISPTHFSQSGEVAFGHVGILGFDGRIYSADARFGGAWAKNFTLKQWQKRFSATNGTYAFVLRAKETEAANPQ